MLSRFLKDKKSTLIKNINLDLSNKNQKKVLISYIIAPLNINLNKETIYHTNILEVTTIIKTFIDLNFCIDLIENDSIKNICKLDINEYDIIFGFGKVYEFCCGQNNKAIKISYITENEPNISKNKEEERIEYFYKRHKRKVGLERSFKYYNQKSFENTNYGIILGDLESFDKYEFDKYTIYPTGLKNENYKLDEHLSNKNNKNFIWIGSRGAVHKGLDIVIDIFRKNRNLKLYLCGLTRRDKKLLKIKNEFNIIDLGRIDIKSTEFERIVDKCFFQVQASCSEACSTSVLTGLRHGLIPIIIKDSGMNRLSEYCMVSNTYKIDILEQIIIEASNKPREELLETSKRNYKIANKIFILDNFKEIFSQIIKSILEREQ